MLKQAAIDGYPNSVWKLYLFTADSTTTAAKVKLLLRSANQGHPMSMLELGSLYANSDSDDFERDPFAAAYWYRRAMNNDHELASYAYNGILERLEKELKHVKPSDR